MPNTILLVEDAIFFEKAALKTLSDVGEHSVKTARTLAEAQAALSSLPHKPWLALVDLTLPDSRDGEIVDLCRSYDIPTIVFTSRFEPHLQAEMRKKGVLDYIIKDSPSSLGYVRDLIQRLRRNPEIGVLVIDDVGVDRAVLGETLKRQGYRYFGAQSSAEGLALIEKHPEIRLVLVDYFMPNEDGFAFLKSIRRSKPREQLAVIGLSAYDELENRIRFLKYGANDFLSKSCAPEELLLRVSQNLDVISRMRDLKENALRDSLTGLHNRRYLFEDGLKAAARHRAADQTLWLVLIDIDHFKAINDGYGHLAGDRALCALASAMRDLTTSGGVCARFGGDEFCAILPATGEKDMKDKIEALMRELKTLELGPDAIVPLTFSAGVSELAGDDLVKALHETDERLYAAKARGRNMVVGST